MTGMVSPSGTVAVDVGPGTVPGEDVVVVVEGAVARVVGVVPVGPGADAVSSCDVEEHAANATSTVVITPEARRWPIGRRRIMVVATLVPAGRFPTPWAASGAVR